MARFKIDIIKIEKDRIFVDVYYASDDNKEKLMQSNTLLHQRDTLNLMVEKA